jgi:hypothetical protein
LPLTVGSDLRKRRSIVEKPLGGGEAQPVTLVIAYNGGITLTEQLGEGAQIKLVALQARLDEHRPRIAEDTGTGEVKPRLSCKDAGTNRAQMLAHGRTWPMVAPTGFEPALPP